MAWNWPLPRNTYGRPSSASSSFPCSRTCAVCKAHQGAMQSLKRSPDGQRLASCGDDGAIQVWDLANGEHLRTLRRDRPYERLDISGVKGLTDAQRATLQALGAVEKKGGLLKE